ncbi:hypothetical protein Tco_1398695 [Tanacetum coccineum]
MVVKKDNRKWKLHVDFTNVNKVCIREPHPIPAAEQKAKGLHKYHLKCFLDAYKWYHQIPIADEDEEKTTFFTREGVFCYKRLPFSLKNVGATYQRLIDKVFGHQMGRNMEVNADDMRDAKSQQKDSGPEYVPVKERKKDTPFHGNSKNLYEWKDGSMDQRSRRSLPKNERMLKVITNDAHTNKGRNSNNVPRNLRRNYERNTNGRKGKETNPVYFVSRTLHGAELEYPELEKLIFSLVNTASRKEPEPKNTWKLFTDEASSFDGLGARLMVVSPEGK